MGETITKAAMKGVESDIGLMELTTASGSIEYEMSPESVTALLGGLLPILRYFSENPRLGAEKASTSSVGIPATGLAISQGRDETDVGLTIHLGAASLNFFVPLNDVTRAMAWLQTKIAPSGPSYPN